MPTDDSPSESNYLSSKDVQKWLLQEIMDSTKAHELRVRDAAEFATAYALGELTPAQAHERFLQHDHRWGEAFPGTHAFRDSTDEQLLAAIDRARGDLSLPRHVREEIERRLGPKSNRGNTSR
jgi:hypothetical protein